MKNSELIPKVKEYLDTKPEERDLAAGALLVLQLTNNRIMYQNFMRRPKQYASRIEYELRKKYQFYLQELTHDQVQEMNAQVVTIVEQHHLTAEEKEHEEFKKGKRADHDALPPEIQALYAENLSIMQQMRRTHTQLQLLSVETSTCPDSERYPFLKELIDLDKRYHANWQQYDHFKVGEPLPTVKEEKAPADETPNSEQATPAAPAAEPAKATPEKKAKAAKKPAASKPKAKAKK